MRLDKFLKISGLIKRRTLSQEACRCGRIVVNGRVAKPAQAVRVGDVITLVSPVWTKRVEVLAVPEGTSRKEPFRIIDEERTGFRAVRHKE